LAATPSLGWNSWNQFGVKVDEAAVRGAAEALVKLGLRDLGYRYVVIDDGWSLGSRDGNGDLAADPLRFPGGIKALADQVHALGLKLGIYSDAAEKTCGGFLGSLGHEDQDAAQWARWGLDFLKYDYCNAPADQATAIERYARMGAALKKTGRPFLYSLCEWGGRAPHLWGRQAGGHQWRVSGDLFDSWTDCYVDPPGWWAMGLDSQFDKAAALAPHGGPGGWNDLDMLVVGLKKGGHIGGGGLNALESRTHMTLFSLACSPLMIGCDLRSINDADLRLLDNPEVLAVNQDPLGRPGRRALRRGSLEAWTKPLADGSTAIALFNRGSQGADLSVGAAELGLLDGAKRLRDLWTREEAGEFGATLVRRLLPHEGLLFRAFSR
jgi:alpha-galactosidase